MPLIAPMAPPTSNTGAGTGTITTKRVFRSASITRRRCAPRASPPSVWLATTNTDPMPAILPTRRTLPTARTHRLRAGAIVQRVQGFAPDARWRDEPKKQSEWRPMTDAPVALVTGASRGIGKASAIALAAAGFDVALAARTVHEGDARSEPNSIRGDDPIVALPGSLDSTAAEVARHGQRALIVPMDLTDLPSVEAAPATVLAEWGRIDVLFNNAIYQGRGTMDRILDMRMDDIDKAMRGNFAYQVRLIQLVVPPMIERGPAASSTWCRGRPATNRRAPRARVDGGSGTRRRRPRSAGSRAGSKRSSATEVSVPSTSIPATSSPRSDDCSIRTTTSRDGFGSAPAAATGAVVAWLAGNDEALRFAGKWIYAPKLCADRGLLPGWPPDGRHAPDDQATNPAVFAAAMRSRPNPALRALVGVPPDVGRGPARGDRFAVELRRTRHESRARAADRVEPGCVEDVAVGDDLDVLDELVRRLHRSPDDVGVVQARGPSSRGSDRMRSASNGAAARRSRPFASRRCRTARR